LSEGLPVSLSLPSAGLPVAFLSQFGYFLFSFQTHSAFNRLIILLSGRNLNDVGDEPSFSMTFFCFQAFFNYA
jgi:hypothetical protein